MVNLTDTATFECTTIGIPEPTLSWFNGSAPLDNSNSRVTIENSSSQLINLFLYQVNQSVTIDNTTSDDTGYYSCIAANNLGMDEAVFELLVRGECLEGACTSCRDLIDTHV